MKANIVDLRYKMKDIIKALDRNESVTVLYRGKVKGIITPVSKKVKDDVRSHPFFGMSAENDKPVEKIMDELRGTRYRDI